jgi:hypothetical protein
MLETIIHDCVVYEYVSVFCTAAAWEPMASK